jgi:hypothetical protein
LFALARTPNLQSCSVIEELPCICVESVGGGAAITMIYVVRMACWDLFLAVADFELRSSHMAHGRNVSQQS